MILCDACSSPASPACRVYNGKVHLVVHLMLSSYILPGGYLEAAVSKSATTSKAAVPHTSQLPSAGSKGGGVQVNQPKLRCFTPASQLSLAGSGGDGQAGMWPLGAGRPTISAFT